MQCRYAETRRALMLHGTAEATPSAWSGAQDTMPKAALMYSIELV